MVIADAGPLIAFSKTAALDVLRQLFGEVWITAEVRDELLPPKPFKGKELLEAALLAGWVRVAETERRPWKPRNPGVDIGEASAIALAISLPGSLLVMDDRAGRVEAEVAGLAVMGTVGIVGLAKEAGYIVSAQLLLRDMVVNGYFIHDNLIAALSEDLGEST